MRIILPLALLGILLAHQSAAETTINGFATIAVGLADNDGEYLGYTQDLDLQPDSKAGVQIGYKVNDKMDATVQILARGADDWDPKMEWAYVSYHADNGTTVRAGKLRLPFYMYSDYLDVGYAQPFLRSPTGVYTINPLFDTYTGVDAIIPVELSGSTLTFQPFYGGVDDESFGTTFKLSNLVGANANWEYDALQIRAIYSIGKFTESNEPALADQDASFAGIGFKYEAGSWFISGEYASIEVDGVIYDTDAAYLAAGYQLGDWTPYISVGMSETTDNSVREEAIMGLETQQSQLQAGIDALNAGASPDDVGFTLEEGNALMAQVTGGISQLNSFTFERMEYSIGTRWDFMAGVALKADITFYDDFNGSAGFANDYYSSAESDVTIISAGIDAVF